MIKKKNKFDLWDKFQENRCGFCVYGKLMADNEHIICQKRKNIYEFNDICKKFEFDILKKDVRRRKKPDFSKFSPENFEL